MNVFDSLLSCDFIYIFDFFHPDYIHTNPLKKGDLQYVTEQNRQRTESVDEALSC